MAFPMWELEKRLEKVEAQLMEINAAQAREDTELMNRIRVAAFSACVDSSACNKDVQYSCQRAIYWADAYKIALEASRKL